MDLTTNRTPYEAFKIILEGLTLQGVESSQFLKDASGNRDPFGFIIGDVTISEDGANMTFSQINETYLDSQWTNAACNVIELCQQIHDGIEPNEWDYYLRAMAISEGLV